MLVQKIKEVKADTGGGTRLRSCVALERELQTKLNQAWRIGLSGNLAKSNAVCRARRGVSVEIGRRKCELRVIESVKELSPELKSEPIVRSELRPLEYR